VERTISDYHEDEARDWVAELSCGHNQHVRHRPPFEVRAWVLEDEGRAAKLGSHIACRLCDRAELPDAVRLERTSPEWDEHTVPAGLLRAHRLADGIWGRIAVGAGNLRFLASTEPPIQTVLGPGSTQAIPPGVEHEVLPLGRVRFTVAILAVDRDPRTAGTLDQEPADRPHEIDDGGGDPACWAGLLCPDCGAVLDGGAHRKACSAGRS